MLLLFSVRAAVWERAAVRVFRERLSVCVCLSFPIGFEVEMRDCINC